MHGICMHGTGTAKKWFPAFCPFNQCIECIIASKKGSAMFLLVLNLSLSSNWAKFAQEFLLWRLVAGNVYILHVYLYLMSAVANRMYVYNKIKTHTLVILMHAKMCIYIYIHMYIILSIIYIVVYIYIYHSISCLSNSRILIADICCFIHPYIRFRESDVLSTWNAPRR